MSYVLDQSGKIEDTARATVVAFANDRQGAVTIPAADRKFLLEVHKLSGKPRMFIFQVFSALVHLLIERYRINKSTITIDIEYQGQEALIKNYILQLSRKRRCVQLDSQNICFWPIGKNSAAHKVAIGSLRHRRTAARVNAKETMSLVILFES